MEQSVAEFFGAHRPGACGIRAGLVTEVVMTMMFLVIIMGAADERAPLGFAPILGGVPGAIVYRCLAGPEA